MKNFAAQILSVWKNGAVFKNVASSFFSRGISALLTFFITPIYVYLLGIESFGIVGFFLSFSLICTVFDFGIGGTLNREMARFSGGVRASEEMRELARTFEWITLMIGLSIGLLFYFLSPFLMAHWLKSSSLIVHQTKFLFLTMGLAFTTLWPYSFYSNGLMGFQKHTHLNAINILCSLIRFFGTLAALTFYSATLQTFFVCQTVANLLQTLLCATTFWRELGGFFKSKFVLHLSKQVLSFAVGMGVVNMLSILIAHVDKLVISRIVSLEEFGHYILVSNISNILGMATIPLFSAYFPRFSQLLAKNKMEEAKETYAQASQWMAVCIIPLGCVICLFSYQFLIMWLKNPILVEKIVKLAPLMIIGSALNALVQIPFAFQLSTGWTRLPLVLNSLMLVFLVPVLIYMTNRFGIAGTGATWLMANFLYLIISIAIMHRKFLLGTAKMWHLNTVILPIVGAFALPILFRYAMGDALHYISPVYIIAISTVLSFTGAFMTTPLPKKWFIKGVK